MRKERKESVYNFAENLGMNVVEGCFVFERRKTLNKK